MDLTALIARTRKVVDDPDITDAEIVVLLNEASLVVADLVRLPSLAVGSGSVTTDSAGYSVAMPSNYHNWAYLCNADGVQVNLRSNMEEMLMLFSSTLDNVGDVTDVTVQGDLLIYQPSPAVNIQVDLFFSEEPTEFEIGTLGYSPTWLPTRFHKMLAIYAGSELWDDVETGDDEVQVNTTNQRNKFNRLVDELETFVTDRKTQ